MTLRTFKKIALVAALIPAMALLNGCAMTQQEYMTENESIRTYDEATWESNAAVMNAAESAGDYKLALATGKDFIVRNPNHVDARVQTARIMTLTGDAKQALRTLDFITPELMTPAGNIEKARAYLVLGSTDAAVNLLERLVRENPLEGENIADEQIRTMHKLYAVALSTNGRLDDARVVFEKLLTIADEPEVRYNYARTELFAGFPDRSFTLLRPIVGTFAPAKPAAAMALWRLGRQEESRALIQGTVDEAAFNEWIKKYPADAAKK